MSRLFPSRDAVIERDGEPAVLYADSEQAAQVCAALSSDTALEIFRLVSDRPLATSEVADELDLSVQNTGYHLGKLQDAQLVEVVDTCYSEKGAEIKLYGVTSDPKVLVLGAEADDQSLKRALGQLVAAVGIPGLLFAVWRSLADAVSRLFDV